MLSRAAAANWIAVGDAAMSFDPIASQGLFNALSSALAAAGLLLSPGGLTDVTADAWSGAVLATFLQSEKGRVALYGNGLSARDQLLAG
jgi:flavin-dependent dehydrogenase